MMKHTLFFLVTLIFIISSLIFPAKVKASTEIFGHNHTFLNSTNKTCKLIFHSNGGDEVTNRIIIKGETIKEPETYRKAKIFKGWYKEPSLINRVNFSEAIMTDLNLYAKWEDAKKIEQVNISFKEPKLGTKIITSVAYDGDYIKQTPKIILDIDTKSHCENWIVGPQVIEAQNFWIEKIQDLTTLVNKEYKEGEKYTIYFYLKADDGYYFTDDVNILFNNKKVLYKHFYCNNTYINIQHTFTPQTKHSLSLNNINKKQISSKNNKSKEKNSKQSKKIKKYVVSSKIRIKETYLTTIKVRKRKISFKWKKVKGVSGYQIQLCSRKNFRGNKKNIYIKGSKKFNKTIIKSHKQYFVRIRAYKKYNKNIYYSKWSKTKKIKTK